MSERLQSSSQNGHRIAKVRVGSLAAKQFGRVTWAQLRALGAAPGTIHRWVASGYLLPVLPRVYAVGHSAPDESAQLFSLALFAGPNASASHGTSAHRRGWLRYPVSSTHISTPRRVRAPGPGVVIHCSRDGEREIVNGIPCTTAIRTLLDLSATEPINLVKRSLAQLDYERKLRPSAIRKACGRGRPGSANLLTALDSYMPELAYTKSDLEDAFLYLCQRFSIPLPQVNTRLHGAEPDCYWPECGLVVELDGDGNHGSPAQRRRDRRKDVKLRAHQLTVIRYGWDQVIHDDRTVAIDVLGQIARLKYPH
ncbi:MAG: type IV toxin-antitoxin system AbiEi family antitoxin domain-containing protein [Acidobacteriota bacterium]|nr:type IV toxin-antitoxin system AbiEi family antitoxin domain-containing protein [Acidobacteriota bacterium]